MGPESSVGVCVLGPASFRSADIAPRRHQVWCLPRSHSEAVQLALSHVLRPPDSSVSTQCRAPASSITVKAVATECRREHASGCLCRDFIVQISIHHGTGTMCPYVSRGSMTVFIHVVCCASENMPFQSKDYNVSHGRHASVGALTCNVACLPLMCDSYNNYLGLESSMEQCSLCWAGILLFILECALHSDLARPLHEVSHLPPFSPED